MKSVQRTVCSICQKPKSPLTFLFSLFLFLGQSQTVEVFDIPGTAIFTVPSGVTQINVECWGAGGAGGRATSTASNGTRAGGGGGAYARSVLNVGPGDQISYTIGAGGISAIPTNGGSTVFGPSFVVAHGGSTPLVNSTTAGAGGNISQSLGDVMYNGGNGGSGGGASCGGGGGGAAGTTGSGGNGSFSGTPGAGGLNDGGAGGQGRCTLGQSAGEPGVGYGGGGGGGRYLSSTANDGGNGANGAIRITYSVGCVPTFSTLTETACGSYTLNSQTYTSSNTYQQVLQNVAGCDSTITLNLTILPNAAGTDVQNSCGAFTWIDGNVYNSSNNTATFTLVGDAENGCDSTVTLNLTVVNINTGVSVNGAVLTAAQAGAAYQWINCSTGAPISGATNQSYTATENGSYRVEITVGSCTELSACESVTGLSLNENELPAFFNVYPNPSEGIFEIILSDVAESLIIETAEGRILKSVSLQHMNSISLDLSVAPSGIYFLTVVSAEHRYTKQLVKN
jgi:hypothetical protein